MTTRDKAYEWIDAHKDDMVDLWKQMVTIDSGIGVKEGGMEMGNLCAGILEKLGFSIRRVSYENAVTRSSANAATCPSHTRSSWVTWIRYSSKANLKSVRSPLKTARHTPGRS